MGFFNNILYQVFRGFIFLIKISTIIFGGLVVMVISGYFEMEVVQAFYPELYRVDGLWYLSIPFCLVACFELTKVYLIFIHKSYIDASNSNYLASRKDFLRLRYFLISLSFIYLCFV